MVCYEAELAKAGIVNVAEEKRRKKVLTKRAARVEKAGRKIPLIIAGIQRLTRRTVKFIRWVAGVSRGKKGTCGRFALPFHDANGAFSIKELGSLTGLR